MPNPRSVLLAAALSGAVFAARADTGYALIQKNNCLSCHSVTERKIGPSYQAIAARYRGDSQAQAELTERVRDGTEGAWDAIPMPAQPQLSDADLKTVIDWVLAQ
jgi:cytochrome c